MAIRWAPLPSLGLGIIASHLSVLAVRLVRLVAMERVMILSPKARSTERLGVLDLASCFCNEIADSLLCCLTAMNGVETSDLRRDNDGDIV